MSYLDVFSQFWLDPLICGFLQRRGIRKVVCIGFISEVIGGVYMKRGSTKEERVRSLQIIKERQLEAERGLRPPIHIFPEGSTTNGSALLQFKKGAFASLKAVKPQCFCYKGTFANPCFGTPLSTYLYCFPLLQCGLV